ncbi:MAG: glucosaminidase domain-containing protein [Clostridiaceae bacterium]|nr:glucosaminidase domain-containing protein [Clostridiaceae bacterium]
MDKQTFINKVKGGAIAAMNKYQILASLTIAQAILESGWGESQLAKVANNIFGMKRRGYADYVVITTIEYRDGNKGEEQAEFRKYPTWDYSIADHIDYLVKNNRYKNLIGIKDYKIACRLIHQDGYATDPNYSNLLIGIIEQNALEKYNSTVTLNLAIASIQELSNKLGIKDSHGNLLVVDGIVGPRTNSVIAKLSLVKKGSTGELVKWIQERLIELGFTCGVYGADGSFGYYTQIATENFQSKRGLKPDGIVGPLTFASLLK